RFTHPRLVNSGQALSDTELRTHVLGRGPRNYALSENLEKIVSEDHFASNNFVAINCHDSDVHDKVHYHVSGSIDELTLEEEKEQNITPARAGCNLRHHLPSHISSLFLTKAANNKAKTVGVKKYKISGIAGLAGKQKATKHVAVKNQVKKQTSREKVELRDSFFERMNHVTVNAQINSLVLEDIVRRGINDPNNQHADDMVSLLPVARRIKNLIRSRQGSQVSEEDYRTVVPYVEACVKGTAAIEERDPSEILGYVIDKVEILSDGSTVTHQPLV